MKRTFLTSLSALAATATCLYLAPQATAQTLLNPATTTTESSAITASSALIAAMPINIARNQRLTVRIQEAFSVQFQGEQQYPLLLKLENPLVNHVGEVLVPAGAEVDATLSISAEGAQIIAHYILVDEMAIPVHAVSRQVPAQQRVTQSTSEKLGESLPTYRLFGNVIGGLAFDDPDTGELVSTALSVLVHEVFDQPDVEYGIYIPQGSYSLTLETTIEVPAAIAQAVNSSNPTSIAPTESFPVLENFQNPSEPVTPPATAPSVNDV